MRIGLLGPLAVTDDAGRPVRVGGRRVRTLLILLALDAGHIVPAQSLISRIWEDERPGDAVNALQSLVSRLRGALGPSAIESSPAGYRLTIGPGDVDITGFETFARDGARSLADGDPAAASRLLREALALWRGPALADAADADFAAAIITRLDESQAAARLDRIEADLLLGEDVVPELRALAAADPLAERPYGLLMRALSAAGRRADALAVYEQARTSLADRLGVDPSPQLEQVYLDILRQDPSAAERLSQAVHRGDGKGSSSRDGTPSPSGRRSAPTWLTSFVGRDQDVSSVLRKLATDRLVTLTGPGGVGKTRLAAEISSRQAGPVYFTELAPVADPPDVPRTVLGELGLGTRAIGFADPAAAAADPVDRVCAALARREITLVLDNCEHVITAAAALAERVLVTCPGVRILATSREPLRIGGETLWALPPLPEPAAARLLRDRARAVRPGFELTAANADAITRICRTLDGMPLAIELAAAWLRTLTPGQLAERLDDRFALLTAGSRTALPRHQTLRAVVDWSWDLLSPTERVLARRLAVFPAGATLTAAEEACADPERLPRASLLPALNGLVAKSILTVSDHPATDDPIGNDPGDEGAESAPRYRMLETVRAYCAERLAEAGENDRVRDALAAYYLGRAQVGDPQLRTAAQGRWYAEFAAEQDNMHAALRWAIDRGDADTALRFVRSLAYFWIQHGLGEGHALAADVLAMDTGGAAKSQPIAEARVITAFLAAGPLFDLTAVRPAVTASLAELKEITGGGTEVHPVAALLEPMLALYDREPERAISLFRRFTSAADPVLRGMGRFYTARFNGQLGRVTESEADCRAALEEIRSLGDRYVVAITLLFLAEFAELRADHAAAIELLAEAHAASAALGGAWVDVWYIDGTLALVRARAGDFEGARADLARVSRAMSRTGVYAHDAATWLRSVEAEMIWRAGDLPEARRRYAEVLAVLSDRPTPWWYPAQISACARLAMAELALGDAARCRELLTDALRLAADWYEHPPLAAVLDATAAYAIRACSPATATAAATLLGAAHTVRGAFDESSLDAPRTREAARDALGDSAFEAAYDKGRGLTRKEAVSLAENSIGMVPRSGPSAVDVDGERGEDHEEANRPGQ